MLSGHARPQIDIAEAVDRKRHRPGFEVLLQQPPIECGRVLVWMTDDERLQMGGASEDADRHVRLELLLPRQGDDDLGILDRIDRNVVALGPGAHSGQDRLGVGAHALTPFARLSCSPPTLVVQHAPSASERRADMPEMSGTASRTAATVWPQSKRSARSTAWPESSARSCVSVSSVSIAVAQWCGL